MPVEVIKPKHITVSVSKKRRQGVYYTVEVGDSTKSVRGGHNFKTKKNHDGLARHWKQVISHIPNGKNVKGKPMVRSITEHVSI